MSNDSPWLPAEVIEESKGTFTGPITCKIPQELLGHRLGMRSPRRYWQNPTATFVDQLLLRRESVRSWGIGPVDTEILSRAMDFALAVDEDLWPDEVAEGVDLEFVLLAWNVDTLVPGVYVRDNTSVRLVGQLPDSTSRKRYVPQPDLALAPVILLAVGNMLASCVRHGSHGYRLLLTRAGAACHTALLSAINDGLCGTIFAGFHADAARMLLGTSMVRRQLLAVAVGPPDDRVRLAKG
jgi:hypothetical protein